LLSLPESTSAVKKLGIKMICRNDLFDSYFAIIALYTHFICFIIPGLGELCIKRPRFAANR
jgi:hypothetical protein